MTNIRTAAIIIIGDEILSGRTTDENINYLALWLGERAIDLKEVRVIADDGDMIIQTVNECRKKYDFLFTTGGIGPTHDDITAVNVAAAFDVPLLHNDEAAELMYQKNGAKKLNDVQLRMALIPKGAKLIFNPISGAPGFILENTYVLAGIPVIMRSMLDGLENQITTGVKVKIRAIHLFEGESKFAVLLEEIEQNFKGLTIGSYPMLMGNKLGATFVLKSRDKNELDQAYNDLTSKITSLDVKYYEGEWGGK